MKALNFVDVGIWWEPESGRLPPADATPIAWVYGIPGFSRLEVYDEDCLRVCREILNESSTQERKAHALADLRRMLDE